MNIIQEKIRSVHVFTPPATLGKQRNNFVSRDNFGPYCTVGRSDLVLFLDFTIWLPFMNEIYLF